MQGKLKEVEKENKKLKSDIKKTQSDYSTAIKEAQDSCEANTELRTKVKTYQDMEVANMEMFDKYKDLQKKYTELKDKGPSEKDKTDDSAQENIDLQILAQFKNAGSRRSPNSDRPMPNPQPSVDPELLKCNRCSFKTVSAERLKVHYKQNHFNCDLCDITLGTATALRAHNKTMHKAPGGTAHKCDSCDFSAVNEAHLKKHVSRHHKQLNCKRCDFRTLIEYDMTEHMRTHRRQVTQCKFGFNCRNRTTCRFEHSNNNQRQSPMRPGRQYNQRNNNPWINPAFVSQSAYDNSFPFLVQAMWQMSRMSRNRGA